MRLPSPSDRGYRGRYMVDWVKGWRYQKRRSKHESCVVVNSHLQMVRVRCKGTASRGSAQLAGPRTAARARRLHQQPKPRLIFRQLLMPHGKPVGRCEHSQGTLVASRPEKHRRHESQSTQNSCDCETQSR